MLLKELSFISFAYISQFFITKMSLEAGPFNEEPNKKIILFLKNSIPSDFLAVCVPARLLFSCLSPFFFFLALS